MTNVTFLPWVDPENLEPLSSTVVGEAALSGPSRIAPVALEPDRPEVAVVVPVVRSKVAFADAEDDEHISALTIDELETTLLRKLHSHDMSVREVTDWLREHDAAEGDAYALVEKCERLGYLNDERLAQELCVRLSERKGKSRSVISRELRQRGLEQAAIDLALESIDADDETQKAIELAITRVRQFSSLDDETANRRLHGFLSRRGYSHEVVRAALAAAMATRIGGSSRAPRFR